MFTVFNLPTVTLADNMTEVLEYTPSKVLDINQQALRFHETEKFGVAKYLGTDEMDSETLAEYRSSLGLGPRLETFVLTVTELQSRSTGTPEDLVPVNVESRQYHSTAEAETVFGEAVLWSRADQKRYLRVELVRRSTYNDDDGPSNSKVLNQFENWLE